MADRSRITVTPAEEEDIVIMAGAVPAAAASVAEAPEEEASAVSSTEGAPTAEAAASERKSSRKEAYRETTLEDLQSTGVSRMQKAIIALAVVAIAAFIVWYVLLR